MRIRNQRVEEEYMLSQEHLFVLACEIFCRYKKEVLQRIDIEKGKRTEETLAYYTPHSTAHFQGVANTLDMILHKQRFHKHRFTESDVLENIINRIRNHKSDDRSRFHPLVNELEDLKSKMPADRPLVTHWERLILYFCAWSHDIGMLTCFYKKYYEKRHREPQNSKVIRDNHDNISSEEFGDLMDEIAAEMKSEARESITLLLEKQAVVRDADTADLKIDSTCYEEVKEYLKRGENHLEFEAFARSLTHLVNLVSLYHRRSEDISLCPVSRNLCSLAIRSKLLAAIFRLADALNVDRSRFSSNDFEYFRNLGDFDAESRLHWMKSYVVSAIELNDLQHEIDIQIDVPFAWSKDRGKMEWPSRIENLASFIIADLEEDVLSVSKILYENDFPLFLDIKYSIHPIPSMRYEQELWDVLNDLVVSSSPNTSRLIESTITAIEELIPVIGSAAVGERKEKITRYRIAINDNLIKRPCHVGLKKIILLMTAIENINVDRHQALTTNEKSFYSLLLECLAKVVREQRKSTKNATPSEQIREALRKSTDLLLYGFSELVSQVIKEYVDPRSKEPKIHIFECRTKTQYTRTGRLLYHDAIRYAKRLRDDLRLDKTITIYPDAMIGTLISNLKADSNSRIIVLFGANAVNTDLSMVHSMGHLSLAEISKEKNIPVYVIADSMKVGRVEHKPRERNEFFWLCPDRRQIDDLRRKRIELSNPNEDVIKSDKIEKIFIIDKSSVLDGGQYTEEKGNTLKEYEKQMYDDYWRRLRTMIVAGKLKETYDKDYGMPPSPDQLKPEATDRDEVFWHAAEYQLKYRSEDDCINKYLSLRGGSDSKKEEQRKRAEAVANDIAKRIDTLLIPEMMASIEKAAKQESKEQEAASNSQRNSGTPPNS
jgi:translation initiation factor 2B subunit (eIF-2B alpha/beta/delta family)